MEYNRDNSHESIQLSMNEIAPLWHRFQNAEPQNNTDLYMQYCELIQEAIWRNQTSEAFHLLVEGIQWYDAVNEA